MLKEFMYCNNPELFEYLSRMNILQFKMFYGVLVHCWANRKCFISNKHFFNLWCELNQFCHDLDESFPDQFDDYEEIRSFCQLHPYYFIDRLPLDLVASLFAEYADDQVDILTDVAKIIIEEDITAAYSYVTKVFNLDESVDATVEAALNHINSSVE